MLRRILFLCVVVVAFEGCTRVDVIKNPGPCDNGFRYYRPKPYLLILPGENPDPDEKTKVELSGGLDLYQKGHVPIDPTIGQPVGPSGPNGSSNPSDGGSASMISANPSVRPVSFAQPAGGDGSIINQSTRKVKFSIVQMQDFSEEYAVQLRPGLGIGELNMTLEDGWNLTAVNVKTDQQTDEIISSVAEVMNAAGALAGDPSGQKSQQLNADRYVPLGLYEAVIAKDPNGRKQFYGWRYVGFTPFTPCPVQMSGMNAGCCNDPYGPTAVYALVFENNGKEDYLAFRKIGDISPDAQMEQTP